MDEYALAMTSNPNGLTSFLAWSYQKATSMAYMKAHTATPDFR